MITKGALNGVRVLDLGRFISAPYCGMIMADMGAEVIRVERPGGDEDRRLGLKSANGENFTFPGLARNKKGITLDLRKAESREVLCLLIASSDVFLHNFSPATTMSLKLAHDDIRAIRQDIIYTGISCYGSEGPWSLRPGFDPIAQMSAGAAALTGFEDEAPLRCGVPWVDYSTGLCAALGTVLALRHRDASGEGQAVDCALLQTAVSYTAPMIAEAVTAGRERPRLGNRTAYVGPTDLFSCRDGFVYIAAATETMWRSITRLIGHPELIDDPALQTDELRFDNRRQVDPLIAAWTAQRTVAEAVAELVTARIPCGVYHSTAEVPDHPQVRACGMLEYLDLGGAGLERVPIGALPIRFSSTPGKKPLRPPRVGEHNREVYGTLLGYDSERLQSLEAQGVI